MQSATLLSTAGRKNTLESFIASGKTAITKLVASDSPVLKSLEVAFANKNGKHPSQLVYLALIAKISKLFTLIGAHSFNLLDPQQHALNTKEEIEKAFDALNRMGGLSKCINEYIAKYLCEADKLQLLKNIGLESLATDDEKQRTLIIKKFLVKLSPKKKDIFTLIVKYFKDLAIRRLILCQMTPYTVIDADLLTQLKDLTDKFIELKDKVDNTLGTTFNLGFLTHKTEFSRFLASLNADAVLSDPKFKDLLNKHSAPVAQKITNTVSIVSQAIMSLLVSEQVKEEIALYHRDFKYVSDLKDTSEEEEKELIRSLLQRRDAIVRKVQAWNGSLKENRQKHDNLRKAIDDVRAKITAATHTVKVSPEDCTELELGKKLLTYTNQLRQINSITIKKHQIIPGDILQLIDLKREIDKRLQKLEVDAVEPATKWFVDKTLEYVTQLASLNEGANKLATACRKQHKFPNASWDTASAAILADWTIPDNEMLTENVRANVVEHARQRVSFTHSDVIQRCNQFIKDLERDAKVVEDRLNLVVKGFHESVQVVIEKQIEPVIYGCKQKATDELNKQQKILSELKIEAIDFKTLHLRDPQELKAHFEDKRKVEAEAEAKLAEAKATLAEAVKMLNSENINTAKKTQTTRSVYSSPGSSPRLRQKRQSIVVTATKIPTKSRASLATAEKRASLAKPIATEVNESNPSKKGLLDRVADFFARNKSLIIKSTVSTAGIFGSVGIGLGIAITAGATIPTGGLAIPVGAVAIPILGGIFAAVGAAIGFVSSVASCFLAELGEPEKNLKPVTANTEQNIDVQNIHRELHASVPGLQPGKTKTTAISIKNQRKTTIASTSLPGYPFSTNPTSLYASSARRVPKTFAPFPNVGQKTTFGV